MAALPAGQGGGVTETAPENTPIHPEDPAEGADTGTSDTTGRTPHPEQPAEGGDPGDDTEQRATGGLDPENRVTGS